MRNLSEYPITDSERKNLILKIMNETMEAGRVGDINPVVIQDLYDKAQVAIAIAEIPKGWSRWSLNSPGYSAGMIINNYRCDLYPDTSSGTNGRVTGFGNVPEEAIKSAIEEIGKVN